METLTHQLPRASDGEDPGRAGSVAKYLASVLLLAAVYYGLARLSLLLALVQHNAAPVWPATGLSLAALLIGGYRMWPGVALGAFAATAFSPTGPVVALGITIGNTLEALAGAYLFRWWAGPRVDLGRVRDAVGLIVLCGLLSTVISTAVGVGTLHAMGEVSPEMFRKVLMVWWAGNISGCIVFAPLLLTWRFWRPRSLSARDLGEAFLLVVLIAAVCDLEFGFLGVSAATNYTMAFALFPPMVWASLRFGSRGATATSLGIALVAVISTIAGLGPFARRAESEAVSIVMLSLFLTTLSATGLLLSAAVSERQRSAQARLESEAKYRMLVEHATDAIVISAESGRLVEANRRGLELLGCSAEQLFGLGVEDVLVPVACGGAPDSKIDSVTGLPMFAERTLRRVDGAEVPIEIGTSKLPDGRRLHVIRNITDRKLAERRSESERQMLELLAKGEPLPVLLDRLVLGNEAAFPGMMCSVLLLDETGARLTHGAAPSLPPAYRRAIDGVAIGPNVGSCGTAAFTRRTVIAEDIRTDPRWKAAADLAEEHGLRACFSVPILSGRGRVLGTFANYYRTPHYPRAAELEMMERCAYLASLAIERSRSEEALRAGEQRLRTIIENEPECVVLLGVDLQLLEMNAAGLAMLEAGTLGEAQERGLLRFIVPEHREAFTDLHRRVIAGASGTLEFEVTGLRGTRRWLEAHAAPLSDAAGKVTELLAIARDITERKRADKQRTMMIRELDHRVKNNLAVVLSIADQTAQSVDSLDEFSSRFASRVKALSRVHALLAKSLWKETDLGGLVRRTLQPHLTGCPSRIRVEGEHCEIPARAAGPLCMTIHELATNALKHGALSVPEGSVDVAWSTGTGAGGTPEAVITWSERGGPTVREPERQGFGVQLIRGGLAHDGRAGVRLEFRPEGVWCRLVLPLVDVPAADEPDHWDAQAPGPA